MPRLCAVLLAFAFLAAPVAAEPPAEHGLAQRIHEFHQEHGGGPDRLHDWGVSVKIRGPLAAEEAQRLREVVSGFYRQAAEARTAELAAAPLLPVRETLALPGDPQRLVTLTGRLLPEEKRLFDEAVDRLRAELPSLAPATIGERPAPDPAAMGRLMASVREFYAEVSQRIIDTQRKKGSGDSFHLCSICDITLDSCLERAGAILDDCVVEVGDFAFCSGLYFDLIRTCHNEDINCVIAFCS